MHSHMGGQMVLHEKRLAAFLTGVRPGLGQGDGHRRRLFVNLLLLLLWRLLLLGRLLLLLLLLLGSPHLGVLRVALMVLHYIVDTR